MKRGNNKQVSAHSIGRLVGIRLPTKVVKGKGKVKDRTVLNRNHHTAMGNHML